MKKLGIIGIGNIGFSVAQAVADGKLGSLTVVAALDQKTDNVDKLLALFPEAHVYTELDAFLQAKPDVVLEAANPAVVRACAEKILLSGADFIPMSVGGLIDPGFIEKMEAAAENGKSNLIVPAGAMTGQNICAAGALSGLDEVVIQSTKGVKGLITAPYIVNHHVELDNLTEPTVVYRGNVFEAVKDFPQNVNVAASLALAGFGCEKTMVEIVCDPHSSQIRQKVIARGAFGEMEMNLKLLPSPNGRSSYMSILGAMSALKKYASPIKFGF